MELWIVFVPSRIHPAFPYLRVCGD